MNTQAAQTMVAEMITYMEFRHARHMDERGHHIACDASGSDDMGRTVYRFMCVDEAGNSHRCGLDDTLCFTA